MKKPIATLTTGVIALASIANANATSTMHPIYGKWTWTLQANNCTETYNNRPDNTSEVKSGDEIAESRFTISSKPDANGFYRMTDEVTKSNGQTGCDGSPGGSPVGDTVTIYVFFSRTKNEMLMCQTPSFDACMGPLQRISQ